jgi:TonB family protein
VPEKKVAKPPEPAVPEEVLEEIKPSGGDEAARLDRRRKIEELEMEARRLYESYTTEEDATTGESVQPAETDVDAPSATRTPTGGNGAPSNIRFRAYHDRIWAKIRSSWVIPVGVISEAKLLTVVGIRIAADGEIEQFWIEEKSGNEYYDQSAIRAIGKANPLPPLPEESEAPLEVGINFRYPE